MEEKTNVMRILDQRRIAYRQYCYLGTGAVSGAEVAAILGQNPAHVFKTLVTVGKSGRYYVFLIPVLEELDLKKAAVSVREKAVDMLPQKQLLPLTGYVHGGCSPIGMKKQFPTAIDRSAASWETILYSAGKIGYQVETALSDLKKVIPLTEADITV